MSTQHILAESRNYKVISEFETVWLSRKAGWIRRRVDESSTIIIGYFYGDPKGAIITTDESCVIMYGRGLIIYRLQEPFEPFAYDVETPQWSELLREVSHGMDKSWWIDSLEQETYSTILFETDKWGNHAGKYRLNLENLAIEKLC
jgi:hypothetical protein